METLFSGAVILTPGDVSAGGKPLPLFLWTICPAENIIFPNAKNPNEVTDVKIYNDITETIGRTPMVRLQRFGKGCNAEIWAKLEYMNPAGSVKDRVGRKLILDAEEKGFIAPGATIIEPTSGNTGIGLAMTAAVRGYKLILTMPETMSIERRKLLSAYGAEIVLTPGEKGMTGAIEKANELAASIPGSYIPGQFNNPANARAHYETTGPEIWEDTQGRIDYFVACIGTGGTYSGVGLYLKEQNSDINMVAVEPRNSAVLSGREPGSHGIQGIGAGFIPEVLDKRLLEEILTVTDEEAMSCAREVAKKEGILVGISSGAALCAARKIANRYENEQKRVVVVLPDTGERYLSSGLF